MIKGRGDHNVTIRLLTTFTEHTRACRETGRASAFSVAGVS
jgi:hypothetical protein